MKLGIYSAGIWKIPALGAFLPEYELLFRDSADLYAGWGLKNTAQKAIKKAAAEHKSYIALEDGFLRSYDLGVNGAAPLSMVVDEIGIYYDSTRTSGLEKLIVSGVDEALLKRAEAAMESIRKYKLSKYNHFTASWNLPAGKYVLVADQCVGDYSVLYGSADENSFKIMLQKAREENPDATIIIKTHPDVVAGKRGGFLTHLAKPGDVVMAESINPYEIFPHVERVYTVTSLIGMEALIYGVPVTCCGMPFYAGWGATTDEFKSQRRKIQRSVDEIFAAAYISYTRYIDPYFGKPAEIEDCIETLASLKNYYAKHTQNYYCAGFSSWKRYFVKPYLKTPSNKVEFFKSPAKAASKAEKDANSAVLIWASKQKTMLATKRPVYRMEDGFVRGAGLGSDLTRANSLIIDRQGIYYDAASPSDIEEMFKTPSANIARASILLAEYLENSIGKYNLTANEELPQFPADQKKILVVGQVESDASIKHGAVDIKTNAELIKHARAANPDAYLIYKPHPDVVAGNREGKVYEEGADVVIAGAPIHKLIDAADEVHTITSLAGFEALLRGKPVFCHGVPFYHGWGLTGGVPGPVRRARRLERAELFASAVVDYPLYYDFEAGLPATAEIIIRKISRKMLTIPNKKSKLFNWICQTSKILGK